MSTFAGFTQTTTLADNDQVVGLVAAGGAGSDRRTLASQIWTYIQSKLFPVVAGAVGTPVGVPFLATTTAANGAGSAGLDQVPTVSLTVAVTVVEFASAGTTRQMWQLVAGTNATDSTHQRPADYNASTNAKVWLLIS